MPSQGGEPQLISDNARLMDWTRDGRYLAVSMERSASEALYLLPMKDGKQAGDPVFVRYGSFEMGRITASGALVYSATPPGGNYSSWLGTLNSDGHLSGWKPLSLSGSSSISSAISRNPVWSPDSTQIAYAAPNRAAGQNTWVVRVRNMASGEERELYQGGTGNLSCLWAALRPNLVCGQSTPTSATTELFSISRDSGRAERLGSVAGFRALLFLSRDDRAIYMSGGPNLFRWEIDTQKATKVDFSPGRFTQTAASPDERWIAGRGNETIQIRPMSGGDWRRLVSVSPGGASQMAFTKDGNWLLYHDVDAAGKQGLFRVATAGGQPERIGDLPSGTQYGFMWISPSPDGQKIITENPKVPTELWILENFEPASPKQ
jgi:Tol biopolymer transport system component